MTGAPRSGGEQNRARGTFDTPFDLKAFCDRLRGWGYKAAPTAIEALTDRVEALETALLKLANAADDVGVRFFDSDDLDETVEAMQTATLEARVALERKETT